MQKVDWSRWMPFEVILQKGFRPVLLYMTTMAYFLKLYAYVKGRIEKVRPGSWKFSRTIWV